MVRTGGVEPPRPFGHRILSPARLPVPPRSQGRAPGPRARPAGGDAARRRTVPQLEDRPKRQRSIRRRGGQTARGPAPRGLARSLPASPGGRTGRRAPRRGLYNAGVTAPPTSDPIAAPDYVGRASAFEGRRTTLDAASRRLAALRIALVLTVLGAFAQWSDRRRVDAVARGGRIARVRRGRRAAREGRRPGETDRATRRPQSRRGREMAARLAARHASGSRSAPRIPGTRTPPISTSSAPPRCCRCSGGHAAALEIGGSPSGRSRRRPST